MILNFKDNAYVIPTVDSLYAKVLYDKSYVFNIKYFGEIRLEYDKIVDITQLAFFFIVTAHEFLHQKRIIYTH